MGRYPQGDGSSPSGPIIRKRDRDRLARYDKLIQRLDRQIPLARIFGGSEFKNAIEKRSKVDAERRLLREWMKGYYQEAITELARTLAPTKEDEK